MKFSAVIFDLFGTIVDGFAASSAGYQEQFAAALGVPHDELAHHWSQLTKRRTLGEIQTVDESIEHVCGLIARTVNRRANDESSGNPLAIDAQRTDTKA